MRLLIVTQYFWPENFRINDLVTELIHRGHEVTVLTGTVEFVVKLFTTLNDEINKFFSTAIAEGIVLPSISVEDETLIPTPEIRTSIMEEILLLKERVTLLENG